MSDRYWTSLQFAALPTDCMGDRRLSLADLKVLCAISMNDRLGKGNNLRCSMSPSELADLLILHPSTVSNSSKKLTRLGYTTAGPLPKDHRRTIRRLKQPIKAFIQIPKKAVLDRRMTRDRFLVLTAVSFHDRQNKSPCYAAPNKLAQESKTRFRDVIQSLGWLLDEGYLIKARHPNNPNWQAYRVVFDQDILDDCSPEPGDSSRSHIQSVHENNPLDRQVYFNEVNELEYNERNKDHTYPRRQERARENVDADLVYMIKDLGFSTEQAWTKLQSIPPADLDDLRNRIRENKLDEAMLSEFLKSPELNV